MRVQSLGWEDPLEKEMATHSSIPGWKIPWTEEPGGLQPTGSQRVGCDWGHMQTLGGCGSARNTFPAVALSSCLSHLGHSDPSLKMCRMNLGPHWPMWCQPACSFKKKKITVSCASLYFWKSFPKLKFWHKNSTVLLTSVPAELRKQSQTSIPLLYGLLICICDDHTFL